MYENNETEEIVIIGKYSTQRDILELLLQNKTEDITSKNSPNIVWGTDRYSHLGNGLGATDPITPEALMLPEVADSISSLISDSSCECSIPQRYTTLPEEVNIKTGRRFVRSIFICDHCGTGNAFVSDSSLPIDQRTGVLNLKLQAATLITNTIPYWLKMAQMAVKACYGYENRGDMLLLARLAVMQAYLDAFSNCYKKDINSKSVTGVAKVIATNLMQPGTRNPEECLTRNWRKLIREEQPITVAQLRGLVK